MSENNKKKNWGSLESKSENETVWFHLNEHRWSE